MEKKVTDGPDLAGIMFSLFNNQQVLFKTKIVGEKEHEALYSKIVGTTKSKTTLGNYILEVEIEDDREVIRNTVWIDYNPVLQDGKIIKKPVL